MDHKGYGTRPYPGDSNLNSTVTTVKRVAIVAQEAVKRIARAAQELVPSRSEFKFRKNKVDI